METRDSENIFRNAVSLLEATILCIHIRGERGRGAMKLRLSMYVQREKTTLLLRHNPASQLRRVFTSQSC